MVSDSDSKAGFSGSALEFSDSEAGDSDIVVKVKV